MEGLYDPKVPGWIVPATIDLDQFANLSLPAGSAEISLQLLDLSFVPVNDSWIVGSIQET